MGNEAISLGWAQDLREKKNYWFPEGPDMKCFVIFLDSNKGITGANQNCRFGTYKNTNLILKTTEWMINKVLSLYYLNLFPLLATVSLLGQLWKSFLFSLRLHDCVDVFIHEKENWQWTFFPPSVTPLSLAVMYPERGTVVAQIYHNRDTFDFSQGHVTKNQPMAVPFSWVKV